jgi:hypothetical protein
VITRVRELRPCQLVFAALMELLGPLRPALPDAIRCLAKDDSTVLHIHFDLRPEVELGDDRLGKNYALGVADAS